jgi:hypothetical protein
MLGFHAVFYLFLVEMSFNAFGTVVQLGTLFWQPEELSEPPGSQSKYYRISLV